MPSTVRLYPWTVSSQLILRALEVYDPSQPELDLSLDERATRDDEGIVELDLIGSDEWRELRIRTDVTLPADQVPRVLPRGNTLSGDTRLLLSIRCPSSKLRETAVLDLQGESTWTGDIIIRRHDVRSRIEVQPFLARTTYSPASSDEALARHKFAVIAVGDTLVLQLDKRRPFGASPVLISWEDFRASDHPWRKNHPTDVYFLSFDDERPHLVLNSAIANGSFKGLLHDKTQKGSTAALRTMATLGIAESVWLKLFFAATAAVSVDETTGEIALPEGWRGALLTRFLSTAFPELPSADDKLERLAELKRDPDQFVSLLTRLGSPLFETLGSAKLIQKALKLVES